MKSYLVVGFQLHDCSSLRRKQNKTARLEKEYTDPQVVDLARELVEQELRHAWPLRLGTLGDLQPGTQVVHGSLQ